jgi:AhpD family alkylhydroperoxidase
MPRIAPAGSPADLGGVEVAPGERLERALGAIWAHRPEVSAAWNAFNRAITETALLSPRLTELVRLRIAFHNQCRSCMAVRDANALDDGLTEELVCSLEQPGDGIGLTESERAAIRFADLFSIDHPAIDDDAINALRRHFAEAEIVELLIQCARMLGFGRLAAVAAVYEDLPDRFRAEQDTPYTPWGGAVIVRSGLRDSRLDGRS